MVQLSAAVLGEMNNRNKGDLPEIISAVNTGSKYIESLIWGHLINFLGGL